MTEISFVKENSYFEDEQRFGPYVSSQTFFFEATENGTKMGCCSLCIAWAFLGRIMNTLVVKSKLEEIFYIEFLR
jgi:hypothetical protein